MSNSVNEKIALLAKNMPKGLDFSEIWCYNVGVQKRVEKEVDQENIILTKVRNINSKQKGIQKMENIKRRRKTEREIRQREERRFLTLTAAMLAIPLAVLSVAATVPLTVAMTLPLGYAFAVSGILYLILWAAGRIYLEAVKQRTLENMAYLADGIADPVEFRCPVTFRDGANRCPGYLLLTYDECHLFAKGKGGLLTRVQDMETEEILLRKSDVFSVQVVGEHRMNLMLTPDSGYQLTVFPMKRLICFMDRDLWKIGGRTPSSYIN